jgi:zinc and cadmium transporter
MINAAISPTLVLTTYCILAFFAALAGGALPSLVRLTHTRLQLAVSFVAGLMLGLSLVGFLPHAAHGLGSIHPATLWMLGGFLVMFLVQRFLPFHHHDVAEGSPLEPCGHTHSLAERSARGLNWIGVAFGLSLHSIFDGLALAAAVASTGDGRGAALGLGAALAVILHKPFGALAITTLMAAGKEPPAMRQLVNLGFALVTPTGALLFYLGAAPWAHAHPGWLGGALAFCAGTFLCIACADLLPELQFHAHDRFKLSFALLLGLAAALVIARFGHASHGPEHHLPASADSQADGLSGSVTGRTVWIPAQAAPFHPTPDGRAIHPQTPRNLGPILVALQQQPFELLARGRFDA